MFGHGLKRKIQLRKDQNRSVNCNKLWSNLTFFRNLMNHGGIEDYCNGRMAYVCVCMSVGIIYITTHILRNDKTWKRLDLSES